MTTHSEPQQPHGIAYSYRLHLCLYAACVIAGLLYMSRSTFSPTVALAGDEWEYQSIAVNLLHGHGFPVSGGYEDSAAYRLTSHPGINSAMTWREFYTSGRGYDFYRNPLYPLFIAAVYHLGGADPALLRMVQFILLILAGALLPYICCCLFGRDGIAIGIAAYIAFSFLDHSYAMAVMCEALTVVYTIIFLLAYISLRHRQRVADACILGMLMGIGLLLKNYFLPLFITLILHSIYQSLISKKTGMRYTTALLLGIALAVLPWSAYASYTTASPILLTTQGADVLLGSNNEFAADGLWHPEWAACPESFYHRAAIRALSGWQQVSMFYLYHPMWVPYFFSSKVMMGLFATLSQLAFYLSALAFVVWYRVKRKALLLLPLAALIIAVAIAGGHVHAALVTLSDSILNIHHLLRYVLIAMTAATLWLYIKTLTRDMHFTYYICLLLLADFAGLTLATYGNSRITGVVDFICLIFTFYNVLSILRMVSDKPPTPSQTYV